MLPSVFVGSPFTFHVSDISKFTAKGSGLGIVPCNKTASFTVSGPGLQQQDLEISIKGITIIINLFYLLLLALY